MKDSIRMPKCLTSRNFIVPFVTIAASVFIGSITAIAPESPKWLIGALILAGVLFFALRSPFYAFLFFVITLPLEATLVIEAGFTIRPAYIALVLIFFSLFLSEIFYKKIYDSFRSPLNLPIFVYIGVAFISLIMIFLYPLPDVALAETMKHRGSEFRGIIQSLLLIFFALGYFLTIYFCSDEKRLFTTLKVYIGVALILSVYGIYQFFAVYYNLPFVDITNALGTGGDLYGVRHYTDPALFRSHATFQEPLIFGHYLLSVIPLLLVLYAYRRKTKIGNGNFIHIGIIPILITLTALIFTMSRGAWLGFLVAFLFAAIAIAGTKHSVKLFFALALTIIGFNFLAAFYLPEYRNLLALITLRFSGGEFLQDVRFAYLLFTLDLFKQYPILGVGIGGYGLQMASYFNYHLLGSAHGIFWSVLAETGIIGFLAFSWLIFVYYKTLIQALKKAKGTHWHPYIIGYLACFTGMMVQYLSFGDRLNMYAWVFMGVSMATVKLIKKEQKQKT